MTSRTKDFQIWCTRTKRKMLYLKYFLIVYLTSFYIIPVSTSLLHNPHILSPPTFQNPLKAENPSACPRGTEFEQDPLTQGIGNFSSEYSTKGLHVLPMLGWCRDINECKESTPCSQHCINEYAGFRCSCFRGYKLTSQGGCVPADPEPRIIITQGANIIETKADGSQPQIVVGPRDGPIYALAIDQSNNTLYWIEGEGRHEERRLTLVEQTKHRNKRTFNSGIWRTVLDDDDRNVKQVLITMLNEGSDLCYDWVDNSLFFSRFPRHIQRFHLDRTHSESPQLIYRAKANTAITGIACDPRFTHLYVSTVGSESSIIELNYRTGELHMLVGGESQGVIEPSQMSLDFVQRSLYFVDQAQNSILSARLHQDQGQGVIQIKVHKGVEYGGLDLLGDELYYTNSRGNTLNIADKKDNSYNTSITLSLHNSASHLAIWHKAREPESNLFLEDSECQQEGVVDGLSGKLECLCYPGYEKWTDGTCVDLNECKVDRGGCSHTCINVPGSFHCTCPRGHTLRADQKTCTQNIPCPKWIEPKCSHHSFMVTKTSYECGCPAGNRLETDELTCSGCSSADNGGCQQVCRPTGITSWECDCHKGYFLVNGSMCQAEVQSSFLLFADGNKLWSLGMDGHDHKLIADNLPEITSLDYDPRSEEAYFTSHTHRLIAKINIVTGKHRVLIYGQDFEPVGLAMDWYFGNLYFADKKEGTISSYDIHNKQIKTLVTNLHEPVGMAIDIRHNILYWSEIGLNPRIVKFNIDLQNITVMRNVLLKSPMDISIDIPDQRVYWSDATLGNIEYMHLNGEPGEVLHAPGYPLGLDVFGKYVWYTDRMKSALVRINKENGDNQLIIKGRKSWETFQKLTDIQVVHPQARELVAINPCETSNGGCDHVCKYFESFAKCECFAGYFLETDGKSCLPHALRLRRHDRRRLHCELCHVNANCKYINDNIMSCLCKDGYEGDGILECIPKSTTPTPIIECNDFESKYCLNNGRCQKLPNPINPEKLILSCFCDNFFTGVRCESLKPFSKSRNTHQTERLRDSSEANSTKHFRQAIVLVCVSLLICILTLGLSYWIRKNHITRGIPATVCHNTSNKTTTTICGPGRLKDCMRSSQADNGSVAERSFDIPAIRPNAIVVSATGTIGVRIGGGPVVRSQLTSDTFQSYSSSTMCNL